MRARLIDLEPHWVCLPTWSAPELFAIGITFLCPHCRKVRVGVSFDPPVDPTGLIGRAFQWVRGNASGLGPGTHLWTRMSGETFDSLTLTQSINFAEDIKRQDGSIGHVAHWHGFVTNGEVTNE